VLSAVALDPLQRLFAGNDLWLRLVLACGVVVTPAVGMGICFPLGLRLSSALRERREGAADLGPWLWGINGAFSVCASALALACSMTWGIQTTLTLGALGYLLLVCCSVHLGRGLEAG
jgi:hypothetical protein